MIRVFVSGCYGLLHPGHLIFFREARALGDHLTVCMASDRTIKIRKGYDPPMSQDHRYALLCELRHVDRVVVGDDSGSWNNYWEHWQIVKPDILAITEDDPNKLSKEVQCRDAGVQLVVLPKTLPFASDPISTTVLRERMRRC